MASCKRQGPSLFEFHQVPSISVLLLLLLERKYFFIRLSKGNTREGKKGGGDRERKSKIEKDEQTTLRRTSSFIPGTKVQHIYIVVYNTGDLLVTLYLSMTSALYVSTLTLDNKYDHLLRRRTPLDFLRHI